jgi:hypothetical protein
MVYTMEFTQIESPDSGLVDIYLEALSKDNGVYVDLAEITNELGDTTDIDHDTFMRDYAWLEDSIIERINELDADPMTHARTEPEDYHER